MVEYRERLAYAIALEFGAKALDKDNRPASVNRLAVALGVSYQAVMAILFGDKETRALTASNNSKAARFLRVDPDWLATGEGQARSERSWPFSEITPDDWFAAHADARKTAEGMLRLVVPPIKRRETMPIVDSGPRQDALHRSAAQKQTRSSKGKRKG